MTVTVYAARPAVDWPAVTSVTLGVVGLLGAAPTMGLLALASVMAVVFGRASQVQSGPSRLATTGMVLGYLVAVPTAIVWLSLGVVAMVGAAVL